MGRNAGGVLFEGGGSSGKSSGKSGGSGSSQGTKGATEKGYTAKMVRNIIGIEQKFRHNSDETVHIFTKNGDIVTTVGGKGARVELRGNNIPPNCIITHNHPQSLGASGIERIGNSFSPADILTAVDLNAKEIRAVTPTYTFSLKRPKGGWGVSVKEVGEAFIWARSTVDRSDKAYFSKVGQNKISEARADVAYWHKVMKILAKKYGWDYSKKNK